MSRQSEVAMKSEGRITVKKCIDCGDDFAINEFRITKSGSHSDTCNKCIGEKKEKTRSKNRSGSVPDKSTPAPEPPAPRILLDFKGHEDIYKHIVTLAYRRLRTVENQIFYMIREIG